MRVIDLCIRTNARLPYYHSLASSNVLRADDTLRGPAAWGRSLADLEEGDELPSISLYYTFLESDLSDGRSALRT